MIDRTALLRDLKPQLRSFEDDLRRRSADVPEFAETLHLEWEDARQSNRTAAGYDTWLDDRVTQSAVAWILATVFTRFCEDNGLIDLPVLSGPGERLAIAAERQQEFFAQHPSKTDRDWILQGIEALSVSRVAAALFDEAHNPMWTITPSHEAAKALLAFWRRRAETGQTVHDFTEPDWNTRFLGDLYQDLSQHAKKTYALLQTPEFVEEFILDYTLTPAIEEFGLTPDPPEARPDLPSLLRVIDPTCGSGHFLLGTFHRLLDQWEKKAPDADRWEQISRALASVHGVDKNPFAAAVARFRLLIAAMKAANEKRLAYARDFPINVAVGDSLLHGRGAPGIQFEFSLQNNSGRLMHTYVTEDIDDYSKSVDMLGIGSYHVVVGNPPYVTVKDKKENANYRAYPSCHREYQLTVPFAERFFLLARPSALDRRGAGYIGQITSNAFMKREFGKKLIEEFFRGPSADLTHVIDTSGAYIPGHGTPTVILIGRRRLARKESTIRVALGIRGEPKQPEVPAKGNVWQAIVSQIGHAPSESEWISVANLQRDRLWAHPWSLSGGGASELLARIKEQGTLKLMSKVSAVGFAALSGEDDSFFLPDEASSKRMRIEHTLPMVTGDVVRDYNLEPGTITVWPYDEKFEPYEPEQIPATMKFLWPDRHLLQKRKRFGVIVETIPGFKWYWYRELYSSRLLTPMTVVFAFVATHNHFVLDRGGKVFKQSAPVIKLPESASEDDHLALLGVLNSSTACFWLKQVCHDKGNRGEGGGITSAGWERFYEFTGTKLEQFPLPVDLPLKAGRELDELARRLGAVEPSAVCAAGVPTRERLDAARVEHEHIWGRMIARQEELDWDVYRRYGLLVAAEAAGLMADPVSVPELKLGERAFEIVLARRMAAGEIETQWFKRHRSTPITEIPAHWPEAYEAVVARRIEAIGSRRDIALIERPECKRRWQSEPWEVKERAALTAWLLDRCEDRGLWFAADEWGREQARPVTVSRLADRLRADNDVVSVARLLDGPDADLVDVLTRIIADQHVPYLAQLRYTPTGMRKRGEWEKTWAKQREEDAEGTQLRIDVPPEYKKEDFLKGSFWSQRGKLDVPKERFISYPLASPDGDDSLLLGWAGWDHREQAHALMTLIEDRFSQDGWDKDKLTPLIAGLAEVMPWVRQWHAEADPDSGINVAEAYDAYLEDQRIRHGFSEEDLRTWSPPTVGQRRGRRRKSEGV
ncbi:MAG TPA: BREX-2 system adenine-specific DNA-methyltransferase PglX [Streptosporangiaceae bacterium]|nr:BREX-2 system adenine-specific DNA-methyltransferase PglX [Streptosporangiaceae bacterium]